MDKSEDLRKKYEISKDEQKNRRLDNWPQHTHTHSNGQFPLASNT